MLSVTEVPHERPPLWSSRRVGELGAMVNLQDKSLAIDGEKWPAHMLGSGHPTLDVAEYDSTAGSEEEFLVAATTVEEESPGGVTKKEASGSDSNVSWRH